MFLLYTPGLFFLALWSQIAQEKNNLAKKWQQIVKFFAKK